MAGQMISVGLVMLFSGVLGGAINFFMSPTEQDESPSFFKSVTIGIGASMMVPLFLNMISSDIVEKILTASASGSSFSQLLVLLGFCLVAAVSSRSFITTLSQKLLKLAEEANSKAKEAEKDVLEIKAEVQPIIDKETEPEIGEDMTLALISEETLTEEEGKLLTALHDGEYTLRSIGGISRDAGYPQPKVRDVLASLEKRDLVSEKDGSRGPKWYITSKGRALTKKPHPTRRGH